MYHASMDAFSSSQQSPSPQNAAEIKLALLETLVIYALEKAEVDGVLQELEHRRPDDPHWKQAFADLRKAAGVADELKKLFRYPNHQGC